MWLYLYFRGTRRAVMAARVLAAGDDTSNSSSRRLIVLALVDTALFKYLADKKISSLYPGVSSNKGLT